MIAGVVGEHSSLPFGPPAQAHGHPRASAIVAPVRPPSLPPACPRFPPFPPSPPRPPSAIFILSLSAFLRFGWGYSYRAILRTVTCGAFSQSEGPAPPPIRRGGVTSPTASFRRPSYVKDPSKRTSTATLESASHESLPMDPPPPYAHGRSLSTSSTGSRRAPGAPNSPPPAYIRGGGRIMPTASLPR